MQNVNNPPHMTYNQAVHLRACTFVGFQKLVPESNPTVPDPNPTALESNLFSLNDLLKSFNPTCVLSYGTLIKSRAGVACVGARLGIGRSKNILAPRGSARSWGNNLGVSYVQNMTHGWNLLTGYRQIRLTTSILHCAACVLSARCLVVQARQARGLALAAHKLLMSE